MKKLVLVSLLSLLFLCSSCARNSPPPPTYDELSEQVLHLEATYDELSEHVLLLEEALAESEDRIDEYQALLCEIDEGPLLTLFSYFEEKDVSYDEAFAAYEEIESLILPYV